jgi:hypothetical protein
MTVCRKSFQGIFLPSWLKLSTQITILSKPIVDHLRSSAIWRLLALIIYLDGTLRIDRNDESCKRAGIEIELDTNVFDSDWGHKRE